MTTLIVDPSRSTCEACGGNTTPYETSHETTIGYEGSRPGCGAVYTHIRSNYFGVNMKNWADLNRPDLIWNGFDENMGG